MIAGRNALVNPVGRPRRASPVRLRAKLCTRPSRQNALTRNTSNPTRAVRGLRPQGQRSLGARMPSIKCRAVNSGDKSKDLGRKPEDPYARCAGAAHRKAPDPACESFDIVCKAKLPHTRELLMCVQSLMDADAGVSGRERATRAWLLTRYAPNRQLLIGRTLKPEWWRAFVAIPQQAGRSTSSVQPLVDGGVSNSNARCVLAGD